MDSLRYVPCRILLIVISSDCHLISFLWFLLAEVPVLARYMDERVLSCTHLYRAAADRGSSTEVSVSHWCRIFQKHLYHLSDCSCLPQYKRSVRLSRSDPLNVNWAFIVVDVPYAVLSSDIDKALSIFNELRKQDPYRIENMDTFSNLLYVRVSILPVACP